MLQIRGKHVGATRVPLHRWRTVRRRFSRRIGRNPRRLRVLLAVTGPDTGCILPFCRYYAAGAAPARQGRGWTKGRGKTKSTKSSSNSRHADDERSPRVGSAPARLLSSFPLPRADPPPSTFRTVSAGIPRDVVSSCALRVCRAFVKMFRRAVTRVSYVCGLRISLSFPRFEAQ